MYQLLVTAFHQSNKNCITNTVLQFTFKKEADVAYDNILDRDEWSGIKYTVTKLY